ncbi:MAG TPA: ABC transporter substrate-binding protein, partial [Candidatus Binatia bacterium]
PPFTNMAEKMGMVRIAFVGDALQIPMSGLVTSEKLLRERPDYVRSFIKATHKGLKYFLDNKSESIAMLSRVTPMEPEVARTTYDFYRTIMTKDGIPSDRALADDFEITRQMLKKEGQAFTRAQAEQKMYDFALLKDVIKSAR